MRLATRLIVTCSKNLCKSEEFDCFLLNFSYKKQLTKELFHTTLRLNLLHYFVKNTIRIRVYFPSGHWNLINLSSKYTAVLVRAFICHAKWLWLVVKWFWSFEMSSNQTASLLGPKDCSTNNFRICTKFLKYQWQCQSKSVPCY
jgi:hypothetical protein